MPTVNEILQSDQTNTQEVVNAFKTALEEESELVLAYNTSSPAFINLLKALEDNESVTSLTFSDGIPTLTDEALDALAIALQKNPHLTCLDLVFSGNTLETITKFTKLLENNQAQLKKLKLGLSVPIDRIKVLANALKKNNTLECLEIYDGGSINDEAAEILADALKKNSKLARLSMRNASAISIRGITLLVEALETKKTLSHFSYVDEAWYSLRSYTTYNKVAPLFVTAFATLLKKNKGGVTTLDFSKNDLSSEDIQVLADALKTNTTLINLSLNDNLIREEGVKTLAAALEQNSTLKQLNLSKCRANTIVETLKKNHILTHLDLSYTGIDVQNLSTVLPCNEGLTELNLSGNEINGSTLKTLSVALQKNHTLTSLGLSDSQITDNDNDMPGLIQLLTKIPNLKKLDLSNNKITQKGIQSFATLLEINQSLTSINLNNSMDISSIYVLTESLKKNSTLTTLKLEAPKGQNLEPYYKSFDDLLKVNTTLTTLEISPPENEASLALYNSIRQTMQKRRIDLVKGEVQAAIPSMVSAVAGVIAEYVGPSYPESSIPTPAQGAKPSNSKPITAAKQQSTGTLAPVSSIKVTEAQSNTPLAPASSSAEFSSKSSSPLVGLKKWLRTRWDKLSTLIHNALSYIKNKFGLTPQKTPASNNNKSKLVPPPDQTAQILAPKSETNLNVQQPPGVQNSVVKELEQPREQQQEVLAQLMSKTDIFLKTPIRVFLTQRESTLLELTKQLVQKPLSNAQDQAKLSTLVEQLSTMCTHLTPHFRTLASTIITGINPNDIHLDRLPADVEPSTDPLHEIAVKLIETHENSPKKWTLSMARQLTSDAITIITNYHQKIMCEDTDNTNENTIKLRMHLALLCTIYKKASHPSSSMTEAEWQRSTANQPSDQDEYSPIYQAMEDQIKIIESIEQQLKLSPRAP